MLKSLSPQENSVLWNAMIHPMLNMTLKGAIWYQGQSTCSCFRFSILTSIKILKQCISHLQAKAMQTIIRTNTTVPFLLWLMTGGWHFTRAQGGRQLGISHLDLSRYDNIISIQTLWYTHQSMLAYHYSICSYDRMYLEPFTISKHTQMQFLPMSLLTETKLTLLKNTLHIH